MITLGVDLGGTLARVARVDGAEFGSISSAPIRGQGTAREVFDDLCAVIDRERPGEDCQGIGIGVPSLVDGETGRIHDTTNIPAWQDVPLREWLEERYHLPVRINNDANCFALGQHIQAPDCQNLVGLVMGTGMGAGIISNGRLHSGVHCAAGEFGMIPYRDGIFEHYVSGQFFQRRGHDAKTLGQAGHPLFEEFGGHLAQVLKVIMYALAPERIVLGGGVSQAFKWFEPAMREELKDFAFAPADIRREVAPYSAMIGAASLLQHVPMHGE